MERQIGVILLAAAETVKQEDRCAPASPVHAGNAQGRAVYAQFNEMLCCGARARHGRFAQSGFIEDHAAGSLPETGFATSLLRNPRPKGEWIDPALPPVKRRSGFLIIAFLRHNMHIGGDYMGFLEMSNQVDGIDRKILSILLTAAATPKAEIARRIGLAASAISERIRRLEDSGIIKGYEARLEARALQAPLLAFIFVRELKPTGGFDTAAALTRVTGVEEVHKIAGEDCFLLKIRAPGTDELGTVLDAEIDVIPTVAGVRTTIVLKTALEGPPLAGAPMFSQDIGKRETVETNQLGAAS